MLAKLACHDVERIPATAYGRGFNPLISRCAEQVGSGSRAASWEDCRWHSSASFARCSAMI